MLTRFLLWLLLTLSPLAAQNGTQHLTILHSNDLHAHLLPDDRGLGGFAQLAAAVRQERAHCDACLYLNAGDLVQGTPVSTIFQGVPVYQIANLLGFDAGVIGNHEFDYGWQKVQEFGRIAHFPLLSANVAGEQGATLTGKPFAILTAGGIRVAIIGVVLGDMVGTVVTAENVGLWHVLPVVETVRRYAREVHDRADLIVVLGHIHDAEEADAILRDVPEVSVVVVGHNHAGYKGLRRVNGGFAVLLRSYGVELGRLDLEVDLAAKKARSAEWKRIPIDAKKFSPAPDVAQAVAEWESKVSAIVDVPIGEAKRRLTSEDLRLLVERAMAEETGSDLAFVNRGNIRDPLPAGRILARAIWNILPFDNRLVIGTFKGSRLPPPVKEGRTIDPDREYTLVTTDFTAANQSAPTELRSRGLEFPRTAALQRDAVIDWIKKKGTIE